MNPSQHELVFQSSEETTNFEAANGVKYSIKQSRNNKNDIKTEVIIQSIPDNQMIKITSENVSLFEKAIVILKQRHVPNTI